MQPSSPRPPVHRTRASDGLRQRPAAGQDCLHQLPPRQGEVHLRRWRKLHPMLPPRHRLLTPRAGQAEAAWAGGARGGQRRAGPWGGQGQAAALARERGLGRDEPTTGTVSAGATHACAAVRGGQPCYNGTRNRLPTSSQELAWSFPGVTAGHCRRFCRRFPRPSGSHTHTHTHPHTHTHTHTHTLTHTHTHTRTHAHTRTYTHTHTHTHIYRLSSARFARHPEINSELGVLLGLRVNPNSLMYMSRPSSESESYVALQGASKLVLLRPRLQVREAHAALVALQGNQGLICSISFLLNLPSLTQRRPPLYFKWALQLLINRYG